MRAQRSCRRGNLLPVGDPQADGLRRRTAPAQLVACPKRTLFQTATRAFTRPEERMRCPGLTPESRALPGGAIPALSEQSMCTMS
eukprot:1583060-Rhodomonas_salina.5